MDIFFVFVIGLCIGSFLNVVILRCNGSERITGRSCCTSCGHALGFSCLIPVVSFLYLRGRCMFCRSRISLQYPIVEVCAGILAVLVYVISFNNVSLLDLLVNEKNALREIVFAMRDYFFICVLLVVFVSDLRWYIVPDRCVLPCIVFSFALNMALGFSGPKMVLASTVLGAFFMFQYLLSSGRWVGGGDIRLGVLVGSMLSWPQALDALLSSYILGAFISILLLVFGRKKMNSKVAYGTFLSLTTAYSILFGPLFLEWYLGTIFPI